MDDEKLGSAKDSLSSQSVASRTIKILKYSLAFGLVWFIVQSWFIIPRHYIFVGSHTSACTHAKYAWVTDAFAPKEPRVPRGRLAENFFLYDFCLSLRIKADVSRTAPYRTRPMQSQRLANTRRSRTLRAQKGTYSPPSTSSIFFDTSSPFRKAPAIPSTLLDRRPRVTRHSLSRI